MGEGVALMTFNRNTAYHEAGHVIANCHFGYGIEYAYVNRYERERREIGVIGGETMPAAGAFHLDMDLPPPGHDIWQRVLIMTLAGPLVEARRARWSFNAVMFGGGSADMEAALRIAEWVAPEWQVDAGSPDSGALLNTAIKATRKFLREPGIWDQIEAVADVLMRDGIIEGDHSLLRDIEGWRPLPEALVSPARRLTRKARRAIAEKARSLTAST
jgi:hypothetical protein